MGAFMALVIYGVLTISPPPKLLFNGRMGYMLRDADVINYDDNTGRMDWIAVGDKGVVVIHKNGVTFVSSLGTQYNFYGVDFADANVGYIVGEDVQSDPLHPVGVIFKTTDGGNNWTDQYTPSPSLFPENFVPPFYDVDVVENNSYYVWVSCGNRYGLRSVNGGQSWSIYKLSGNLSDAFISAWAQSKDTCFDKFINLIKRK